MAICMDIDENSRKATIKFYGKDNQFWSGNYGPRIGYCFARILNDYSEEIISS